MITRAELDYRLSLQAGDSFEVSVKASHPSRVRLVFEQEIRRQPTAELMLEARITATAVNQRKRPYFPDELKALL